MLSMSDALNGIMVTCVEPSEFKEPHKVAPIRSGGVIQGRRDSRAALYA